MSTIYDVLTTALAITILTPIGMVLNDERAFTTAVRIFALIYPYRPDWVFFLNVQLVVMSMPGCVDGGLAGRRTSRWIQA